MAEFGPGWGMQIEEAPPEGKVTDAPIPIAVRVRLRLNNGDQPVIQQAWALAWTQLQVLVYWRDPRRGTFLVWVPATRVRHRDSPIR